VLKGFVGGRLQRLSPRRRAGGGLRSRSGAHDLLDPRPGHARDRYFRESGGAIRFFFEEDATDQPMPLALNKIGHALHDLDPVSTASRASRAWPAGARIVFVQPLLLQSMASSNSLISAPRSAGTRTRPTCTPALDRDWLVDRAR
jgi:hypothetical protein